MEHHRQASPPSTSAMNTPANSVQYAMLGEDGNFRGLFQVSHGHELSELESDCSFALVQRRDQDSQDSQDSKDGSAIFPGRLQPFSHHGDVVLVQNENEDVIGMVFFDEGYDLNDLFECLFLPIAGDIQREHEHEELQSRSGFALPAEAFSVWSDPISSDAEASGSGAREALCADCSSLGLAVSEFDATDDKEDRKLFVRSLESIREHASCSLCRHVAYAVDTARPTWERDEHVPDEEVMCTAWLQWHRWPTTKRFRVIDITTNLAFHGPSYGVQLFPVQKAQHRFLGRLIDPQAIQPSLVRKWLQRCDQKHLGGECSTERHPRFEEIANHLFCIDVEKAQLVRPTGDFKYVALSYVWGRKPITLLKKQLLASWTSPGGLTSVIPGLPKVIRDAIDLTGKIGERFLWVDSLCIVQDDNEMKAKLISKMNLVYQNALLTIFAASGEDADAGLPGVRKNTRNFEQKIAQVADDLSFICPKSHSSLSQSTWASRGWTYQEFFFSKRRLIFHDGIIFFKCNTTTWREDLALERFGAQIDQFDLSKGFDAASEAWEPPTSITSGIAARENYEKWLQAYMNRNLSFDSDAMNAFAGILDFSASEVGFRTYFGLSEISFGLDMFWQQEMFMIRRPQFPSWSWTGWKGRLLPSFSDPQSVGRQYYFSRWLSWYKWGPDVGISPVVDYEDEESWEIGRNAHRLSHFNSVKSPLLALAVIYNRLREEDGDYGIDSEEHAALYELKRLSQISDETLAQLTSLFVGLKPHISSLIVFRTITIEVWASALAPDNSIPGDFGPVDYAHMVVRPALYLYSTVGPDFEPIGLAWVNEKSTYNSIRDATVDAAEGLVPPDEPDKGSQVVQAVSRARDDLPNDAVTIQKMREMLELMGQEPDGTENLLPQDSSQRGIALRARQIRKVSVEFLSGPLEGNMQSRVGTPKAYPYTTQRGFFRVMVLNQAVRNVSTWDNMADAIPERLGIGELELFALDKLPDLRVEEVVLK